MRSSCGREEEQAGGHGGGGVLIMVVLRVVSLFVSRRFHRFSRYDT